MVPVDGWVGEEKGAGRLTYTKKQQVRGKTHKKEEEEETNKGMRGDTQNKVAK